MNVVKALPVILAGYLPLISGASTLYVDLNCTNPVPPFAGWSTASTNIQVAVDAANVGDVVLVSNGTYSVGGRVAGGLKGTSNRISVEKALTVSSVNGPAVTSIVGGGRQAGFARGVYLTNGAVLSGFTITNGTVVEQGTGNGGGIYCVSTNCLVTNCVIIGNSAVAGGGAWLGTLVNCTIFSNTASSGGGACQSVLRNCAIAGNNATQGAGAIGGLLNNCTLSGNIATSTGGGAYQSALNNCIVYFNTAPSNANAAGSSLNYCCTTPLPPAGTGNIDSDPQLASMSHLSPGSPCRGAGSSAYSSGVDIDGDAWASPPSMGCDEYWPGQAGGPISLSILAQYTNCAAAFPDGFTGWIWGKVTSSSWDFGDGTVLSNRPYASHLWSNGGDFPVVLTAYNQDNPGGISATVIVHVVGQPVHYVSIASTNPVPPYTSWDTAATDIQSAVDTATAPGESVLVSNGLYSVGARLAGSTTNRVVVPQRVRLTSINGPLVTAIQGQRASAGGGLGADAVRCVYLGAYSVLDGFTLTNGTTTGYDYAGGVYCQSTTCTVTNCILSANYAYYGGGGFFGTFFNCTFQFNSAYSSGGACYSSTLNNCVLHDNGANNDGGGAYYGTLNNCTLSHNRAEAYGGGMGNSTLNNCILDGNLGEYGGGSYYGTANNCIYTNNYAYTSGGGIYYGTANNCLMIHNGGGDPIYNNTGGGAGYYGTFNGCLIVNNDGDWNGGGTFNCTVNNSVLTGNGAINGGGAMGSTLRNCTVVGNTGIFDSGGVIQCALYNSIVFYNTQNGNTNNYGGGNSFSCCSTTPDPGAGAGNITNEPVFVDLTDGDLHLQPTSPCINSGNNSLVSGSTDLDGNPRIAGGTVDIGAYEFPNPASMISYAWLQRYGLATDGSADFADPDGDGMNTWQEWRSGTTPTNAASVLKLVAPTNGVSGFTITWQSVSGVQYYLQRADPSVSAAFSTIQSNLVGAADTTSFTDTNAVGIVRALYRIGVQ